MDKDINYSESELMIVTMARMLKDAENVFMGVASNIPFFSIWLAKKLYNKDLAWLTIPGRVNPEPVFAPKTTVHRQLTIKSRASLTLADIFDMAARGELDVAFLSGIQIDRFGDFNLSHIKDGDKIKSVFTGGAGSALIYTNTKRVIIWRTKHDTRTFIKQCPVITASGNLYRVVSNMAVFRRDNGQLALESIHPYTTFDEVAENTEFAIEPAPMTAEPTEDELSLLREFDVESIREIEF